MLDLRKLIVDLNVLRLAVLLDQVDLVGVRFVAGRLTLNLIRVIILVRKVGGARRNLVDLLNDLGRLSGENVGLLLIEV